MIRVFLTSSHLSAVAAAMIARQYSSQQDKNFLLIDHYGKKKSLVNSILDTTKIFSWVEVVDFSYHLEDTKDLNPGWKKRVIRKFKTLPLVSNFYEYMLQRHNRTYAVRMAEVVGQKLKSLNLEECDELYLLTQTALNESLLILFKNAKLFYYEHGLGDYYYFFQRKLRARFVGFFAEEFRRFQQANDFKFSEMHQLGNPADFEFAMEKFHFRAEPHLNQFKGRPCAIFLMDALEGYNPPVNFWTDYLEKAIASASLPKDCVLLVKPHPNQSNGVMEITSRWLKENKINHFFLSEPDFVTLSVEVIFSYLKNETVCLISTFSSAIFYLAKFYPDSSRFLLMYDFVEPYTKNAPRQYLDHFYGLKPFIEEVFMQSTIERVK